MLSKIVIICGPTAVGKTSVSIELAKRLNGEIVCADSQQVYREMDVGTAKANLKERSEIKHHLLDVINPCEHFDVSRFCEEADCAIRKISDQNKLPIVVGGTGMYIRILCHGLCEAPPQDEEYRKELLDRIDSKGTVSLHDELKEKDPEVADKLSPNDRSRIIRALEVLHLTGESISKFQQDHKFSEKRYDYLKIGLQIDRAELYDRINQRVDEMIANGWVDETRALRQKYPPDCQAFKAVGYHELHQVLNNQLDMESAVEEIKKRTRRFAKRQFTWFKADNEIHWFDPDDISSMELIIGRHLL